MEYIIISLIIGIVLVIISAMYFFAYLANKYRSRHRNKKFAAINETSPYRKSKPHFKPNNEILSKDRGLEKLKQERQPDGVSKYNDESKETAHQSTDIIVGFAKTIGIWTEFVQKQKIGFLLAMQGLQGNKKGFWVNAIKAQEKIRGKGQNRGR